MMLGLLVVPHVGEIVSPSRQAALAQSGPFFVAMSLPTPRK